MDSSSTRCSSFSWRTPDLFVLANRRPRNLSSCFLSKISTQTQCGRQTWALAAFPDSHKNNFLGFLHWSEKLFRRANQQVNSVLIPHSTPQTRRRLVVLSPLKVPLEENSFFKNSPRSRTSWTFFCKFPSLFFNLCNQSINRFDPLFSLVLSTWPTWPSIGTHFPSVVSNCSTQTIRWRSSWFAITVSTATLNTAAAWWANTLDRVYLRLNLILHCNRFAFDTQPPLFSCVPFTIDCSKWSRSTLCLCPPIDHHHYLCNHGYHQPRHQLHPKHNAHPNTADISNTFFSSKPIRSNFCHSNCCSCDFRLSRCACLLTPAINSFVLQPFSVEPWAPVEVATLSCPSSLHRFLLLARHLFRSPHRWQSKICRQPKRAMVSETIRNFFSWKLFCFWLSGVLPFVLNWFRPFEFALILLPNHPMCKSISSKSLIQSIDQKMKSSAIKKMPMLFPVTRSACLTWLNCKFPQLPLLFLLVSSNNCVSNGLPSKSWLLNL